jgi:hypothetical protein
MASSGVAGPESGDNDPYTDSGAKYGRVSLPSFNPGLVDLNSIASVYGVQGSGGGADYLDYNIKVCTSAYANQQVFYELRLYAICCSQHDSSSLNTVLRSCSKRNH